MNQQVIVAEKGAIKPAKRRQLEGAGYIVLIVDNVEKVKILAQDKAEKPADDGFNLDD